MQARRLLFPRIRQVTWESFDVPGAPDEYTVIAEAICSMVSAGTEVAIYTGSHIGFSLPEPPFPLLPARPGYALVGRVIAAGRNLPALQIGQRVVMDAPHGSVGIVDVRRGMVLPLPDELSDEAAALIPMAGIALSAVRMAPVELGDTVAVVGMGVVGQLAAQLYRLNGARPVIGIDRIAARLEIARQAGTVPLHAADSDLLDTVAAITDGRLPDVVVEATGTPSVVSLSLELVREGGRVVLLGSPRGRVDLDTYSLIHRRGVSLIGAHERVQSLGLMPGRQWTKARNLEVVMRALTAGDLRVAGLISHRIPAQQAPQIFDALADSPDGYLGVLIDWGVSP